jgi:DNA-binding transcriptional LysR family regulator
MSGLADLRMFKEIANAASLSVAANRLGMAPATISGRLKALEDHYGVKLLRRTTRSVALTNEGRLLLEHSRNLLDSFDDLEHAMGASRRQVAGRISILSPASFGRRVILPLARAFASDHPDIAFVFNFAAGESAPELDFDIVIKSGDLPDSSRVTRRLTQLTMMTCAAPSYLAAAGTPDTPDSLSGHQCLLQVPEGGRGDVWSFRCNGRSHVVRVGGPFEATDLETLVELAVYGFGIVRAPIEEVAALVESGALCPILEQYAPPPLSVHLLTDGRGCLPARTADFVDYLVRNIRNLPAVATGDRSPEPLPSSREIRSKSDGVKFFFLQN